MATYDKEIDYNSSTVSLKLKERSIYGSSRLGVRSSDMDMLSVQSHNFSMKSVKYEIGKRTYELSNHLGNVLSVISDKVIPSFESGNLAGMLADVRVAQDYSPFGVTLSGRSFEVDGGYRYGFNSMEKDDEVKGRGNSYDFGARMHDPRLGRFLSLDPKMKEFSWLSPYAYAANNPIIYTDENGEGPGDRVKVAVQLIETYKRNGTKYSQDNRQIGLDVKYSDCSAFVTTVLNESGYANLFNSSSTGAGSGTGIQGEIKSKSGSTNLKDPYTMSPKQGDIMMWRGHITIVTLVTDKEVQFAGMGGSGANIGRIPLTNGIVDMTDKKTKKATKMWGGGGFWGFWSPESTGFEGTNPVKNIGPEYTALQEISIIYDLELKRQVTIEESYDIEMKRAIETTHESEEFRQTLPTQGETPVSP